MVKKNERTMEAYKTAGASMRLLKEAGSNAVVKASVILPAAETDRFMKLIDKIEDVASEAEKQMFTDHPELSGEYTDVFYGNLSGAPRTDVDAEVIRLAKEQALERFESN